MARDYPLRIARLLLRFLRWNQGAILLRLQSPSHWGVASMKAWPWINFLTSFLLRQDCGERFRGSSGFSENQPEQYHFDFL